jgi:hypothetical protein
MDLIEVVLTVCLVTQPTACSDKHLTFCWQGSLHQCRMSVQPEIAKWIGAHPEYFTVRRRCECPDKGGKDI